MLPPNEIKKAAGKARKLADELDRHAMRKDQRLTNNAAVHRHRQKGRHLGDVLAAYITSGLAEDAACRIVAGQCSLTTEQIRRNTLPTVRKMIARRQTRIRTREILMLAHKGLQDAEIAARVINPRTGKNYHPKAINRILKINWKITKAA